MTTVIQYAIDAISVASLYAVLALGIALIFGVMRLINFAHGELIMIGGYALLYLADVPWPLTIAATVGIVVVFALALERSAFRPVRDANPATLLVTSFALSYMLQNLALIIFGGRAKTVPLSASLAESFEVGDLRIPKLNIVTVAVTAALLVGLVAFLKRTPIGIQMRAAAEDFTDGADPGRPRERRDRDRVCAQRPARGRRLLPARRARGGRSHRGWG